MECFSHNVIPKFLSEPISFLLEDERNQTGSEEHGDTVVLPTVELCDNTDTEGAIESLRINGVSAISGLNSEKMYGLLSPGTKQTVRNNEVSVLSGCP